MIYNAEDFLWKTYNNITLWLKFAEEKNYKILIFIGLQILLLQFLKRCETVSMTYHDGLLLFTSVFLSICFLSTLISLYPILNITKIIDQLNYLNKNLNFFKKNKKNPSSSTVKKIIHFRSIAKDIKTADNYIQEVSKYTNQNIKSNEYLIQLCEMIVNNSKVAVYKTTFYTISILFMILGELFFISWICFSFIH